MSLRTFGVGWLLLAGVAGAQLVQKPLATTDTPWQGADGSFAAMLLVTDEPAALLEGWQAPRREPPTIRTVSRLQRGDTATAVLVFSGCAPGERGQCRTVAVFRVLREDGSVHADADGVPLWMEPPPTDDALQLGRARLAFTPEAGDPLGVYTLEATLRDLVAGREVVLVQSIEVLAEVPGLP